jgi:hypothetical protein
LFFREGIALFKRRGFGVRFASLTNGTVGEDQGRSKRLRMVQGLTEAAGLKKRLQRCYESILSVISMSLRPNADSPRELT